MSRTGEHLYQLVQAYAALGDHHTGTPVDHATRAWFATEELSVNKLLIQMQFFSRWPIMRT